MSGFAGIVGFEGLPADNQAVDRMTDTLIPKQTRNRAALCPDIGIAPTYTLARYHWGGSCYYRVGLILLKLRGGFMEVFRLNRIISSVYLFALVADDLHDNLHSGHRINPSPSQRRAREGAGRVCRRRVPSQGKYLA